MAVGCMCVPSVSALILVSEIVRDFREHSRRRFDVGGLGGMYGNGKGSDLEWASWARCRGMCTCECAFSHLLSYPLSLFLLFPFSLSFFLSFLSFPLSEVDDDNEFQ
jgi:hypothetical protein